MGHAMAKWRAKALEFLPELRSKIIESDSVMEFWIALRMDFEDAYRDPRNESLIERTYAFADWCIAAPRNPDASRDPPTSVMVCFYEHIPQGTASRADMPRWFTFDEVRLSKSVFSYMIGEEAYEALLDYMKRNQKRYVPRRIISKGRDKSV
jgi:hypothetical protein